MKFKEQKDGIILVTENDNIIAKYKVNDRWREVNSSVKEDGLHIRLFDKYKKYNDVIVKLNIDEIQYIPNK